MNYPLKIPAFAGLSVFLLWGVVWSQETAQKKIPPSKPLPPPQTQVRQDTTRTQEPQKERLELPDVLILGKDTAIKKPATKSVQKSIATIYLQPFEQGVNKKESLPGDFSPPQQTPEFKATEQNHATSLELRYGTYNSAFVDANHWQKMKRLAFNFNGNYDRSDGQFANSQYERWRVALQGEYQFSQNHTLFAGGNYLANEYGLWAFKNYQRKWQQFTVNAGLKGSFSPEFGYNLSFEQTRSPLQKNIETNPAIQDSILNSEKNRTFRATLYYQNSDWRFQASGQAVTNDVQKYSNGILILPQSSQAFPSEKNSFSAVDLSVTRFFQMQGFIKIGVLYENYNMKTYSKQQNRVSPLVEFSWKVVPSWRLFTSYKPHFRFVTHQELFNVNPFFFDDSGYFPVEDIRHAIDVGLEWKIFRENRIRFTYQYRSYQNLIYWDMHKLPTAPVTTDSLFSAQGLPKANLSFLKIDLQLGELNPFRLRSSLTFLNSDIVESGIVNPIAQPTEDIPYFEDVSWPSELQYRFQKDWTLSFMMNYYGSRAFSFYSNEAGKSIWLFSTKLNYQLSILNFYLLGRNLFDQKFEIWLFYPETGAQFFIGMKANF